MTPNTVLTTLFSSSMNTMLDLDQSSIRSSSQQDDETSVYSFVCEDGSGGYDARFRIALRLHERRGVTRRERQPPAAVEDRSDTTRARSDGVETFRPRPVLAHVVPGVHNERDRYK